MTPTTPDTSAREIVQTRTFDAPRERVFDAFTQSAHVAHWWGPDGFTLTTYEMDVRPGGVWRYMMHGPDGRDWPNRVVYTEVSAPEKLAYDHGDFDSVHFQVVITFVERDGKTELTMRSLFPTAEARDAVASFAIPGGQQTLARLAAFLAQ